MYHRAVECRLGNPVSTLRPHFTLLRARGGVILPGEPLRQGQLNICLTFDDAYADFYARVFPLLKEFSLRALVAVPTKFILEKTALSTDERLSVSADNDAAMRGKLFETKAPFCTWEELREMTATGVVQAASHSHSHANLKQPEADVEFEAAHSKKLLEQSLRAPVTTFVYPFGGCDARSHRIIKKHYDYAARIGGALNTGWHPRRQPLCRVEADRTPDLAKLLTRTRLTMFRAKWFANSFRARLGKWS
jgi:peptidoglycan/xylan/chitin deacetylase (PgdA/CDA1 family)